MSRLQEDLLKFLDEMARARDTRERTLARELIRLYEEARRELHLKFLEAHSGSNTLRVEQIDSIMRDIERQLSYYSQKAAGVRSASLEEAFKAGQDIGFRMISSGPIKAGLTLSLGQVNRGMVEALVGDSLQRIRAIEQPLLLRIREELVKGAIMGESIPKIGRRILGTGITQEGLKKPFPSIRVRCETIARTEVVRASAAGYIDTTDRMQRFLGEEIYSAWVTAGDDRVDPPCPALARGTDSRFKSVEGMPGVYRRTNLPVPTVASHPRCRCRLLPVLRSWVNSGALNLQELRGHS